MIRVYPNEEFKEIYIANKLQHRSAVSNKGRLVSFLDDINSGRSFKGALTYGYRMFRYKLYLEGGKIRSKHLFIFKLVGEYFIPKTAKEQIYVSHLDCKRDNDDYRNLKWATREEMIEHSRKSPFVKQAKLNLIEHSLNADGRKLTVTKVMRIKKLLAKPHETTRLKIIAKLFGVSEMQIRRIKSGENWSQITI